MHTSEYEYEDYDVRYSEYDNIQEPKQVQFHYNSDLSGEVHINDVMGNEVKVPGWMLMEFVGGRVADDLMSRIEGMSGRELLKWVIGGELNK